MCNHVLYFQALQCKQATDEPKSILLTTNALLELSGILLVRPHLSLCSIMLTTTWGSKLSPRDFLACSLDINKVALSQNMGSIIAVLSVVPNKIK